mgnify:CR=1 FL=1
MNEEEMIDMFVMGDKICESFNRMSEAQSALAGKYILLTDSMERIAVSFEKIAEVLPNYYKLYKLMKKVEEE